MTSKELYEEIKPRNEMNYSYAYLTNDGLEINLEGMYSKFIKDAARCNCYNADVWYDIKIIKEAMTEFNPSEEFDPIWVGFRKMGVDSTSFVISRINENDNESPYFILAQNYFALYSVNVVKDGDHFNVVLREYGV